MNARSFLPALALVALAAVPARADDSLQRVLENGVLKVGAEPGTPPMLFKDGGRYDGFDWAIASSIAKRIGADSVVIVPGKYSELPGRLVEGKFDVIVSGYTADPSIAGVDWSDSYLDYGLCLVVRKGSPIRGVADLRDKVVGAFNDPAAEKIVREIVHGPREIQLHEDGYFDLLDQGKLDAFIYDFPYAQEEIKAYDGRLEIVEYNLSKSTYNVGVRKGSTSLLKVVNAAIKELKASDEYGRIIRKYLGGAGPAPVAKVEAGQSVYTVQAGDSLSAIAKAKLGNMRRWEDIWHLNQNRIADPNLIAVGWQLLLPEK
jgi:ABC-type amino acid transport substrate-binding protein